MTTKPSNGRMNAGKALVECIRREGVRHVFCVPGESYLAALDAFYDVQDVRLIVNRQEGGACFMAEAYGKTTRRAGVAFVTRGPGATNGSIGVHAARQDSTPLVVFVGQVPRRFRGREALQEMDYQQFFGSVAKWVVEVTHAEDMAAVTTRAFQVARSGRPGPVVVVIPEDMLVEEHDYTFPPPSRLSAPHPEPAAVANWIHAVNAARRPVMVVGAGVRFADARQAIVAFSERFQVPVLTGFRRMDSFPNDHRHYLGNLAIGKNPAQTVFREADLVIALGTRLPEITTMEYELPAPGQRLIHVDVSPEVIGKNFPVELGIVADARAALEQALEHPAPAPNPDRDAWIRAHRQTYEQWSTPTLRPAKGVPMEQVSQDFNALLPEDAILTVDAGNFSGWIHRYRRYTAEDSFLGPTLGSMGYGLPAAMAAKLAHPERVVVANSGDGGFLMTGQELATAVQYGVNVIQVVYNNGSYGTIRMHQEREFPGRTVGTDIRNPEFAALARACGALGLRAERPEEFRPALQEALAANRPALIEVITDIENISAGTTLSQMRGKHS
jgi:acetolactate synthase-1/2/3 large subunit